LAFVVSRSPIDATGPLFETRQRDAAVFDADLAGSAAGPAFLFHVIDENVGAVDRAVIPTRGL